MKQALAEGLLSLLVGIVCGSVANGPQAVRIGATALDAMLKAIERLAKTSDDE